MTLFVLTLITISRVHQHYPVLEKSRPALLLVIASIGYAYPDAETEGGVLFHAFLDILAQVIEERP